MIFRPSCRLNATRGPVSRPRRIKHFYKLRVYPEGDAELNVMEFHGIAVLRWHPDNAGDDVLGAMHHQEAAHTDDVEDALAIPGRLRRSQVLGPPSC
jgi:hypothetical protein